MGVSHWNVQYSKFDGFSSIFDMVKRAKSLGMTACGLTDHGTFAGALEFLRTCREEGIRPILGMEAYLSKCHTAQSKNEQPLGRRGNRHINLIAKDYTGFQNICALSQIASLDGFYYDPRLDADLLWEYREGVIATSACLSNLINTFLADDQYNKAKAAVSTFKDIYGEDFYLEMMFHGIDREAKILPEIQRLSRDTDVKIIITNDCFIAGTMILTDRGAIPIENLKTGDKVVTHKNRLKNIENINKKVVQDVYTVKTNLGTTAFVSTGGHPVFAAQRKNNTTFTSPEWKKVSSLSSEDYLILHKTPYDRRFTRKDSGISRIDIGDYFAVKVRSVTQDAREEIVYNLQVEGDESYVANSYVVHNCHYIRQEDAEFHEIVMCISSGKTLKDPKRLKFPHKEFYFKSKDEMAAIFGHLPRAMNNTLEIAEKCDYSDIIFVEEGGTMKLPKFNIPEEFKSPYHYLEKMAKDGLSRLGLDNSKKHVARLDIELSDIRLIWDTKRYDFATYFLVVEDIMRFAKEKGIDAGVRGSGYGSLLLKSIGIVEGVIDPLEFNLLWERFLGFDSKFFLTEDDFGPVAQKGNLQKF